MWPAMKISKQRTPKGGVKFWVIPAADHVQDIVQSVYHMTFKAYHTYIV